MQIVTVAQMRDIEATAETQFALDGPKLMAAAGRSLAMQTIDWLGDALEKKRFLILVGPGNNGGDGRVMAEALQFLGFEVAFFDWKTRTLEPGNSTADITEWSAPGALDDLLAHTDVVVDALLGIGVSRPLNDEMQALTRRVRDARLRRGTAPRIVAVDVPSGVNSDTGEVSVGTLAADLTITLGAPKIGLFWYPAAAYLGELRVGEIGLPPEMHIEGVAEMVTPEAMRAILPPRKPDANKGTFGKVLVVAGSPRFPGAALMCATGAARSGAGLVTIATTPTRSVAYVPGLPEATYVLLPDDPAACAQAIIAAARQVDALAIGPGIDQEPATREWYLATLRALRDMPAAERPHLLLDADGLNLLSKEANWWLLPPPRTVLTPHPGEMARLMGRDAHLAGSGLERLATLRTLAQTWGHVIVLKGAITTVVAPDGPHHARPWLNFAPNPAMAAAGMGDVLSGIIVGLLAQGMAPEDAAVAGAALHSAAGYRATHALGDIRAGLLALDLATQVPAARQAIQGSPYPAQATAAQ
jgi:hydroxyethylthiazole kinase-like uncharacterized protein yjeF